MAGVSWYILQTQLLHCSTSTIIRTTVEMLLLRIFLFIASTSLHSLYESAHQLYIIFVYKIIVLLSVYTSTLYYI